MKEEKEYMLMDYDDSDWDVMTVPGTWKENAGTNKGFGYLRLRIYTGTGKDLSVYVQKSNNASVMYVNNRELFKTGEPGNVQEKTIPHLLPQFRELPESDTYVLVWKISNFHDSHGGGGPQSFAPVIGLKQHLTTMVFTRDLLNSIILGIFIMMSLYHFILWINRRDDKSSIYFALFCFFIVVRLFLMNDFLERLFPGAEVYEMRFKFEFLTIPICLLFFFLFLKSLFPGDFHDICNKVIIILLVVIALFIICTPMVVASLFLLLYQIIVIIVSIYSLYVIVRVIRRKREGAFLVLTGIGCLFLTIMYDILLANKQIFQIYKLLPGPDFVLQFGVLIFIFFQAAVLSTRFTKAYKTADHLSKNLQMEVKQQTNLLNEQKFYINQMYEQLKEKDKYKTEFFQNVTHELRTPLTMILGPSDTFIKKAEEINQNQIMADLQTVQKNAIVLNDL